MEMRQGATVLPIFPLHIFIVLFYYPVSLKFYFRFVFVCVYVDE